MDIFKMSNFEKGPITFFGKMWIFDFAAFCSKIRKNTFFQQSIIFFAKKFGAKSQLFLFP
jgi:hypothetical protein